MYRHTNEFCLSCGSVIPTNVTTERYDDYTRALCGECNRVVVEYIYTEDGRFAESSVRPPQDITAYVGDVDFSTFEVWWTDKMKVGMVNGRVVAGDPKLVEFIEKMLPLLDDERL